MNPETSPITAAMAELQAAYATLSATGAVDAEPEALQHIEAELQAGRIDPDEALRRVRGMLEARQSYH